MKTPLMFLASIALLVLSPLGAEEAPPAEPTVMDTRAEEIDPETQKPRARVTQHYVLTEAQLRERMTTARPHTEPDWFLFVPEEDRELASKLRSWNATNDKRKKWEKQAAEFTNWIRLRVEAGPEGRKKERPTITLSPAEFLSLCVDTSTTKWNAALVKWANRAGAAAQIDHDLAGVIKRTEVQETPTEAELAFAERAREVRAAFGDFRRGKAEKIDLETLRAFVAAMK